MIESNNKILKFNDDENDVEIVLKAEMPERLYKYYALNQRSLNNFTSSKIHFSHPYTLNDIMDGNFQLLNLDKVYEKFIQLLTTLNNRTFSSDELKSIEEELDRFDLESKEKKKLKYFKNGLTHFENFLKEKLQLTSKGHFTKLGGGLGMSFGILFGVVLLSSFERSLGITYGMLIAMVLGVIIGKSMDTKAKQAGRAL